MIDEPTEEDAALYAVGALEPEERSRFEGALTANPELRELVNQLQLTVAQLAYTAPPLPPPDHVRTQLLAAIKPTRMAESSVSARRSWVPWAMAAAFAVATCLLAFERMDMRREIATLRGQDELSKLRIATLSSQLDGFRDSAGTVAWDATKQRGILTLEKLPPAGPAQDYQLWVIDPQYKQPVSGGIVRVDEKGNARLVFTVDVPIRSADQFAVSREQRGGSPTATGPIILLGK